MISIVIPVYNAEDSLTKCLNSVINQTYRDIEIILVNDGSTDNSEAICNNFAKKDRRIKVIHKQNGGVSSARNTGIKYVSSKYLMFVDSDDIISNNMCERLYKRIENGKFNTAICGYERRFIINKAITKTINVNPGVLDIENEEDFRTNFGNLYEKSLFNAPWGKLYNYEIIKKNEIIFNEDLNFGEDLLFNQEYFYYVSEIAILNECLYYYNCDDSESLTRKFDPRRIEKYQYLFNQTQKFCANKDILENCKSHISKNFLKGCFISIEQYENVENKISFNEKRKIIGSIINTQEMYYALHIKKMRDIEHLLYWTLFKMKNANCIWIGMKVRLYIKNRVIRGKNGRSE